MPSINGDRLLADLYGLRAFGATGNGVVRPTYSNIDMDARRWLQTRMADSGLDATLDGIGNVFGRSPNPGPTLIVGSHSDTQPTGGWLDGALGVVYGLEVARAMLESSDTANLAIDVVAWADEEATYSSCLGSKSFCGDLTDDEIATATNAEGETVADALERVGLDSTARVRLDPRRHIGYLEAHIEQGPTLEEAGQAIGVVTSIVGIRGCRVVFEGQQNHAGTTPMDRRRDAGVAMFDYAVKIREMFEEIATPSTVWTIGTANLSPGAPSIIPGRAEFLLQFRDPDNELLDTMQRAAIELATTATVESGVTVTVSDGHEPILPTQMDDSFTKHIAAAAVGRVPGSWRRMPSAAGHDPMIVSNHLPCGMLFIPSIDGISHDFAEDSSDDDIVTGCRVLADAVEIILRQASPR